MSTTYQSDVGRLRRAVVKHARDAFVSEAAIDARWRLLGYRECPDFSAAAREYDAFAGVLDDLGIELLFLPADPGVGLDSLYTRDASIVSDRGVILGRMGKRHRRGEPAVHEEAYGGWGVPVLSRISEAGRLEGGDVVWIDRTTVAVGQGYRSNAEGVRQLVELLGDVEVVPVPLPHVRGPDEVLHLMSLISLIDRDLAVVYSPFMSVPFRQLLLERGFDLVEVPEEEYDTLGCNVLTVAPRVCVVAEGNPVTRRLLERAGVEVYAFTGLEICLKGSGGPTCLTRTLEREG